MRQHAQFGVLSVEKLLGALPVVAGFCCRLKIRDVINDACPVRDLAELTHGQVIEALVANRLTSPSPLVLSNPPARRLPEYGPVLRPSGRGEGPRGSGRQAASVL